MSKVYKAMGPPEGRLSGAEKIRQSAENVFESHIQWIEEQSVDTLSSARLSAALLNEKGIKRITLVRHVWRLLIAVQNSEAVDLIVIPAPMRFSGSNHDIWALLPSASALKAGSPTCMNARYSCRSSWRHLKSLNY